MPPPKTFVKSRNQMSRIPCSSRHGPPSHHSTPYRSHIIPSHDSPNPSLNLFPTLIPTFESIRYLKNQFLFLLDPFPFKNPIQFHSHFQSVSIPLNQIQITLKSTSFKIQFLKSCFYYFMTPSHTSSTSALVPNLSLHLPHSKLCDQHFIFL